MATSLLALLDDIATVLDDIALLSKVAAKKTAGVLGDDLALNAEQVAGVAAERELPVVWAVFKGSLLNKLILVPAALLISIFVPIAITPLLVLGGLYLCYEGVEKLAHALLHSKHEDAAHEAELMQALQDPQTDLQVMEKDKIKGAIRTDFVLSAEIIAITLGVVQDSVWSTQLSVLAGVALLMTIGVYGLVAAIVKLDDMGLYLTRLPATSARAGFLHLLGRGLLGVAPRLMKLLSVLGTVAMFLVGGGILTHGILWLHHAGAVMQTWVVAVSGGVGSVPNALGYVLNGLVPAAFDAVVGVLAGAVVLLAVLLWQRLVKRVAK